MAARSTRPTPYNPGNSPNLPGGDSLYLQQQLTQIGRTLQSLARLIPQAAAEAPKAPIDGTIRLSRSPWRPIGGVVTDSWVFWDAPSGTWKLLHSN